MITLSVFRCLPPLMASALLVACAPSPKVETMDPGSIKSHALSTGKPLTMIHVWATWCEPCREEFPELMKVFREYRSKGLSLVLVSADDPANPGLIEAFLQEHSSPVGSLVSTALNQQFVEALSPIWSGALPASFFFNSNGTLLTEWEGEKSYSHYAHTIETLLKQNQGDTP